MNRNIVIALIAALVLGSGSFAQAKYIKGYKVVEVAKNQLTIQMGDEAPVIVSTDKAKRFKVGDKVKYDADKMKVRSMVKPPAGGC